MKKTSRVPTGRLNRLTKLGGLAAKLTGSVIANTAGQIVKAQKPTLQTTVLTSNNAQSITSKLAQMRGAAMKVGQLMSLDAGEFLPAEWEPILAQLRQGSDAMPKEQLLFMLNTHWGENWMENFSYFSFEPIASASIGQVHKAVLKSGETLAIKVQYPGVAESIDSDVNNLGRLLKLAGFAPPELDLDELLKQAKEQLKREADYEQEIRFMQDYAKHVENDSRFLIPEPYLPLCNRFILSMSFIEGIPLDGIQNLGQQTVDSVCKALMELTLDELFITGLMQSDPNFANYYYQPETGKIVLLDFGACCKLSSSIQSSYKKMAECMKLQDREGMKDALLSLGLIRASMPKDVIDIILDGCLTASECLQRDMYNFKQQLLVKRLYAQTEGIMRNKNAVASPSFDSALVNRKISGMILLANKLSANLALRQTLDVYLSNESLIGVEVV